MRVKVVCESALAIWLLVSGMSDLRAGAVVKRNLEKLTAMAELIIVGKVVSVTDGLVDNFPYTEVTIEVSHSIKGDINGTRISPSQPLLYTFRQFGLLKPRDMGNGLTNLNVALDGWPTYQEAHEVMLFLYKEATITGVRTTVGLNQGAFTITNGGIVNGVDNIGLFEDVDVPSGQLTAEERKMLQSKKGPANAQTFIACVDKAVNQGWW